MMYPINMVCFRYIIVNTLHNTNRWWWWWW